MRRRGVLGLTLTMALLAVSGCGSDDSEKRTPSAAGRPNVLLIVADDVGYTDVGFFGAWAIFTLAWLAGFASMLPLGVGSWETAAVWAFQLYGVDASTGAAGAVLLRTVVTLPALVLGLVSLRWLRVAAQESA